MADAMAEFEKLFQDFNDDVSDSRPLREFVRRLSVDGERFQQALHDITDEMDKPVTGESGAIICDTMVRDIIDRALGTGYYAESAASPLTKGAP